MPITPLLEASSYKIDCGLKPSFAKASVPDDDGSYFLTGVEISAQDKPSVPDETAVEETDLKLHDNVSTLFQLPSEARAEVPLCIKSAYLGPKVNIRLKGENSVAMGTAHRLVSEAAPSLKDLHKLHLFVFECSGAYAPSELEA